MDREKITMALQRVYDYGNAAVTYGCMAAVMGIPIRFVVNHFERWLPAHLQAIIVKGNRQIGNGAPYRVQRLNREHFGGLRPVWLIDDPLEFLQIMQESKPAKPTFEQELKQELETPASKPVPTPAPDLQLQVELERLKNENLKLQLELAKLTKKPAAKKTTTKKSAAKKS